MPSSKLQTSSGSQVGFFNKFKVVKQTGKSNARTRSKFDPQRRLEVKAVRGRRACLRCSLLRIKCSHDDICATCDNLAKHAYEKQTMSFSGCIRTRLDEVNIFDFFIPSSEVQEFFQKMSKDLASSIISLDFDTQMIWNLDHLVSDIANWFKDPSKSTTSKVGILSSRQFLQLLEPIFEEDLRIGFQCMIYAISLAYTQPAQRTKHGFSIPELYQIGSLAGQRFLKALDNKLKVESLKRCSHDDLRALFLLVFGTILAIGYTDLPSEKNIASSTIDKHTPWRKGYRPYSLSLRSHHGQFYRTRKFLGQILAHYIVYLGAKLKLSSINQADNFILATASSLWNSRGAFIWKPTKREAARLHTKSHPEVSYDDFPIAKGAMGLKSDTIGDNLINSAIGTSAEYSRPTTNLLRFEEILLPERDDPPMKTPSRSFVSSSTGTSSASNTNIHILHTDSFMQHDQDLQLAKDNFYDEPMPSAFDPASLEDHHCPWLVEQDKIAEQPSADLFKSFNSLAPIASLTAEFPASLDNSIPGVSRSYWCQTCEKALSSQTEYCSNTCASAALDSKLFRTTTSHSLVSQVAEWSSTMSPGPKLLRDQTSTTKGFDWSSYFYHSQAVQEIEDIEFGCTHDLACAKTFTTKRDLARLRKSHRSKSLVCTVAGCCAAFPRYGDLLRHEWYCHARQSNKKPGADDAHFDLESTCRPVMVVNPEKLTLPEEIVDRCNDLVKQRILECSRCSSNIPSANRLYKPLSSAELLEDWCEGQDWIATAGQHLLI